MIRYRRRARRCIYVTKAIRPFWITVVTQRTDGPTSTQPVSTLSD